MTGTQPDPPESPAEPHPGAAIITLSWIGTGVYTATAAVATVSPETTASSDPPLAPSTCGTPAAAASRNTIPNPSCSSPNHRLRHAMANTSAQP